LDEKGITEIFTTCPPADGLPFDAKRETEFENGLTFELWVGLWQKVFCEKPKQAFKFLLYTGYSEGTLKNVI
jgi:hypothetical protein